MKQKIISPKRILLKLSWEALQWKQGYWIEVEFLDKLADKIVYLSKTKKIQVIIVIWWGNIFRWNLAAGRWMDRTIWDYMWMIATIINGLAIWDAIERKWQEARVMSAIESPRVAESFIRWRTLKHLRVWRVVICVWWSWNPYFTTDSAAILRSLELSCDMVVKWTKVDWVYDKDPVKFKDAKRYESISMTEALEKWLRIMDQSAIALAKDEKMPIFVCKIEDIDKIWSSKIKWTYISVN